MKVVVIGNGVAGEAACSAIRSRSREVEVALISQESHPFYSPCILTRYVSKEINRRKIFLKNLRDYKKEGIDLFLGRRVDRVDPLRRTIAISDGEGEIIYDKLILATGSLPIIPPIEGIKKKGVRFLKSLADADWLSKKHGDQAIVIGSGPIGVEIAIALRRRNWGVCLIESLDWILPSILDEPGSSRVRKILEGEGIEVLTSKRVLAIEGGAYAKGVVMSGNGGRKGDLIVLATGMRPSVELARQAGIEIGETGGIRTNDKMETNIKDIYACGDCVEGKDPIIPRPKLSLLWPHAERQGRVAGLNSIGENRSVRWMPDVINLEVFGKFVGAVGQPGWMRSKRAAEVLEVRGEDYSLYMAVSNGKLLGVQLIGGDGGLGTFLPLIGGDYKEIYEKIHNEQDLARTPWYFPVRNCFAS